jgi:hypothetical protein
LSRCRIDNRKNYIHIFLVNAEDALQKQIELYRGMSGEQRLKIALGLHDLSCEMARAGIRHQFPRATPEEVESKLRERIALAHAHE